LRDGARLSRAELPLHRFDDDLRRSRKPNQRRAFESRFAPIEDAREFIGTDPAE
jgi:hypothetical protein